MQTLQDSGDPRPWLLYGMNLYAPDAVPALTRWASHGLQRPLIVSEFGPEDTPVDLRGQGYAKLWHEIRSFPDYVLGGAPYVWTTAGPELTDVKWGLTDAQARPIDNALALLAAAWRAEPGANRSSC